MNAYWLLLEQQVAEVEALQATYPEDGAFILDSGEVQALAAAQALLSASPKPADLGNVEQLSGRIRLQGLLLQGEPVGIHFSLPKAYPLEPPVVQVDCQAGRSTHDALTQAVAASINTNRGTECLLGVLDALMNAVQSEQTISPQTLEKHSPKSTQPYHAPSCQISRCTLWFHHIKALSKRKSILAWAGELGIGGFSKPGFPGVVICEGWEGDVSEFVTRIRHLRWQAMSVRTEELVDVKSGKCEDMLFKGTFRELGEGDMDVLASECHAAGLEHLFLAAMKL